MFFLSVNLLTNLPMGPSRGASYHAMGSNHGRCVSVEPLPKQGCEPRFAQTHQTTAESQWNPCRSRGASGTCFEMGGYPASVSVEPLPKQGCEMSRRDSCPCYRVVSVEPLPKQGCEIANYLGKRTQHVSQWNPCRSRGASGHVVFTSKTCEWSQWNPCRSRGASGQRLHKGRGCIVSVEPLPKQGCERFFTPPHRKPTASQWNPCRSRGASMGRKVKTINLAKSQWNPCRSRGARSKH